MAYTTINKSTAHFNTKLYTGNGSTNAITGVGFEPSLTWIKNRSNTSSHNVFDAVRGATKAIFTNATDAEATEASRLSAFGTDGFTINGDTSNQTNANNDNFVSWNWKANGAGSSNTDGTITSTVSANTTAGFSIVKWTGNGTAGATVGHGLGSAPKVVITKRTDGGTNNWVVGHGAIGFTEAIYLNSTSSKATDNGSWNNTAPSSTVFTVGSNNESNGNGYEFISYCFAEKTGYSKFGSYAGNQNANGTFVYTGFKPEFVMVKRYSAGNPTATKWVMLDNKRDPENTVDKWLYANGSDSEYTASGAETDFVSNGFKIRGTGSFYNDNGHNYIYMAFGQSLVGSNNVPCTAR